jgi:hypothetical protein
LPKSSDLLAPKKEEKVRRKGKVREEEGEGCETSIIHYLSDQCLMEY